MTIEQAEKRIAELEARVEELEKELEYYRGKKLAGRTPHDERWTKNYNDWVVLFEDGKTQIEISEELNMSRRTYYRYKAYYTKIKEMLENKEK